MGADDVVPAGQDGPLAPEVSGSFFDAERASSSPPPLRHHNERIDPAVHAAETERAPLESLGSTLHALMEGGVTEAAAGSSRVHDPAAAEAESARLNDELDAALAGAIEQAPPEAGADGAWEPGAREDVSHDLADAGPAGYGEASLEDGPHPNGWEADPWEADPWGKDEHSELRLAPSEDGGFEVEAFTPRPVLHLEDETRPSGAQEPRGGGRLLLVIALLLGAGLVGAAWWFYLGPGRGSLSWLPQPAAGPSRKLEAPPAGAPEAASDTRVERAPGEAQGADAPASETGPGAEPADTPRTGQGEGGPGGLSVLADAQGSVPLNITSLPRGSQIFVDGEQVGETPATVDVPKGRPVELALRAVGYATARRTVTLGEAPRPERFRLQPLTFSLSVRTQPRGEVSVRGETYRSPAVIDLGHLDAPTSVSAYRPGYRRTSRPVRPTDFRLRDGRMRHDLTITLSPLPGPTAEAQRARPWPSGEAEPEGAAAAVPAP